MSAPLTTSYIPFDSEAPRIFRTTQVNNYINGDRTLLLYDHAITLDKEVEWIWTLRWGLPKIVFFVNRYVICSLIFCNFYINYLSYVPVLVFCVTELLLVTRTIIRSLRGFLAGASIGGAVSVTLIIHQFYAFLNYKFLPGCSATSTYSNPISIWPAWAVLLLFEGVLMLLTAYKLFSYRNRMNQIVVMLARDSIVYFIVIFACLILDILADVDNIITTGVSTPTQCVTSIAVGRMMMNIRGLIMDDPEHTTHLQTLQFATRTNADSEMIEEGTRGET
ncbi:hypothetical protein PILCRDRAFT_816242 [Piloderma croceum F 1598]|uniref:DUF6533 domain-containing protein n=1 Tax=Piloderma croceum (strain F 1598) TaxID=765440 RepID=A0A0C3G370_PILCF|nr:hypothetical protein PILCRDRAFT_816242 [Piloderma croceum F 1598]